MASFDLNQDKSNFKIRVYHSCFKYGNVFLVLVQNDEVTLIYRCIPHIDTWLASSPHNHEILPHQHKLVELKT